RLRELDLRLYAHLHPARDLGLGEAALVEGRVAGGEPPFEVLRLPASVVFAAEGQVYARGIDDDLAVCRDCVARGLRARRCEPERPPLDQKVRLLDSRAALSTDLEGKRNLPHHVNGALLRAARTALHVDLRVWIQQRGSARPGERRAGDSQLTARVRD